MILLAKIYYIQMLQKTLDVLKEFQAHQGARIKQLTIGQIQKRPGNEDIMIDMYKPSVQVQLKHVYESKLNPINKRLEEFQIDSQLDTYKQLGGKFKDYGLLDNVFDEGKTQLAHRPGEVLLIDVWATWCGPCQKPMKHNQEMLQKNEGIWGDKVRIIGVSVDESKDVIKERVTNKKWQKIVHLTLLGWKEEHQFIKDFKISGIPFICLVDKWGNINFTDHPSSINLQQRINELLNKQEDDSIKPAAAPIGDNSQKQIIEKDVSLLTKENIQKEFKDSELICFRYVKTQSIQNGVPSTSLTIKAYFDDADHVAENTVKKLFQNHPGVELDINKVKYVHLPQVEHPQCSLCHTKNLQYPFYWLRWEQGTKFGCRQCVQKKSTVPGHHHAYQKNSVLLFGKWQKVSEKDLGKNLQPQDVTKVLNDHEFGCNGCQQGSPGIGHARYISLGCHCDPSFGDAGYLDLCDSCMYKAINKDQQVLDRMVSEGHKDNHPFLRILYNTKGYQEF